MWRQTVVQNWISNGKYITYLTNYAKSGDRENAVGHHCSKAVFLNRRDASRYRDLETFLQGLDILLKLDIYKFHLKKDLDLYV